MGKVFWEVDLNNPDVRIYTADLAPPSERFMAFLLQEVSVVDAKGRKTGEQKIIMLPVRFMADSAEGARNKAIAFWQDEIAKERAKKERGADLGNSRKAVA